MMNTPICDFVKRYCESKALRAHMPGHKGRGLLGIEDVDITEICGADSLYEADGIIAESEKNASILFGADTYYSTEGSSQCIRAMLYLAVKYARLCGRKPLVLAGRNAHKAFMSAAVLLDFEIQWLCKEGDGSYLSCGITASQLEREIVKSAVKPAAVYITSPDYLGNISDIAALSVVCRKYGVLLLVDNAHGAYLKFLKDGSCHPIDLGADICCDSAHKTLPALTGAAYLHISHNADKYFSQNVKRALDMFGSTSPSYLILQSLDAVNKYISQGYPERLSECCDKVKKLKERLAGCGFEIVGDEKQKITLAPKSYGYDGRELAEILSRKNIICEFFDRDFIVFMLTPQNSQADILTLESALSSIKRKVPISEVPPCFSLPKRVLSPREASFLPQETVKLENAQGRILSSVSVGCPPAVPIAVCGERIDADTVKCFEYYGITECVVVKNEAL